MGRRCSTRATSVRAKTAEFPRAKNRGKLSVQWFISDIFNGIRSRCPSFRGQFGDTFVELPCAACCTRCPSCSGPAIVITSNLSGKIPSGETTSNLSGKISSGETTSSLSGKTTSNLSICQGRFLLVRPRAICQGSSAGETKTRREIACDLEIFHQHRQGPRRLRI